jgi:hypothetical protein
VIKSFARRAFEVRAAHACALLGAIQCFACNVYDADLLDERASRRSIREQTATQQMIDASVESDAAESNAAEGCGDGVVGEEEQCDTSIARGSSGACPDGCSGGQGCERNVLEGSACQAHCVVIELTESAPADGCCLPDTDYAADSDCPARCGNGEVEPGEMCDPADTCPTKDACKSEDKCLIASYSGAADSCDAECTMTQIRSCRSGDGCCPPGCEHARDGDCATTCPEGSPCPMSQMPEPDPAPPMPTTAPMPPPFDCKKEHDGGACRACDCERCGAEVAECLNDKDADDAMFCGAAIDCSEKERCDADRCYCGTANADTCVDAPRGPCLPQWEEAARSTRPSIIALLARTNTYTLNKAVKLITCREQKCAKECGITP